MFSYTFYQVGVKGELRNRENLNDQDEMFDFVNSVYGKYGKIAIINDQTGERREFMDDGAKWDRVA